MDDDVRVTDFLQSALKRVDQMMGELSDKAWEYAGQVADPLFAEAGIGPDRSEVFLVGTHMEMALAAMAAEVQ